jgi:hypothetical protein
MRAGDLVVGIEGTTVKGICELKKDGWTSYQFQLPEVDNYAHTIGFPIDWVDGDPKIFGFTPTAPGQSVPGIAGLQAESQQVINAWKSYQDSQLKS